MIEPGGGLHRLTAGGNELLTMVALSASHLTTKKLNSYKRVLERCCRQG